MNAKFVQFLLVGVASFTLAACNGKDGAQPKVEPEDTFSWVDAPEDSKFAMQSDQSGIPRMAIRCWKKEKFDCVVVNSGPSSYWNASRATFDEIPVTNEKFPIMDGYSCAHIGVYLELIRKSGDQLLSNGFEAFERDKRWSTDFVRTFMAKNGVGGTLPFQCPKLLILLRGNSLQTLATTAVSYRYIEGD